MTKIVSRVCFALVSLACFAGCADVDDPMLDDAQADSTDGAVAVSEEAVKAPVGKRACFGIYNNYHGMATVTAEPSLTVRSRPSTSSPVVASVKEGAKVYVNNCSGGWAYITINPALPVVNSPKGWVSGEYLLVK